MAEIVTKHLVDYLPAIFQEPPEQETTLDKEEPTPDERDGNENPFVDRFLRPFERVLLGSATDGRRPNAAPGEEMDDEDDIPGLKQQIAALHRLFDPIHAPEEFLPWLAGWTALTLRSDLSTPRKRQLIARMIPLYSIRGTRKYVEELLKLHLEATPIVIDFELPALQIGNHSMIGDDTCLGGGPAHYFRVILVAPLLNERELATQREIARSVIEQAKPAHTYYDMETASPRLEVGVRSRLGLDSVLSPAA